MSDPEDRLLEVRSWIDAARRIVVLTGAGISTDSGIPDFRGPNGLWTKNPEAEKLATIDHYMSNPEARKRSWQSFLDPEGMGGWDVAPNDGHRALLALERRGKLHAVLTQNVDGLHQLAGTSPELVVEIHGTLRDVVCMGCAERAPMERALDRVRAGEQDPACRSCGGILKSATISFGQNLVAEDLMRAERAAHECDLMVAIGTTLTVTPIANVVPVAKQQGARVVILNAESTAMDDLADAVIRGSISEILPRLVAFDA
jgi:NAD-dependent deacetylase